MSNNARIQQQALVIKIIGMKIYPQYSKPNGTNKQQTIKSK
jgi:hypothetical protein